MLGRARYAVVLCERGGRQIDELPWSSLSYGRVLDGMSSGSASVPVGRLGSRKSTLLASIDAFEHELAIHRGNDLAWVGPVRQPRWVPGAVGIAAQDLFQWFERRTLPLDRFFIDTDLAEIFAVYVADALAADPSPNIAVSPHATGVIGSRGVVAAARRRAADELRELARNGVDFTVIGRTVRCGGEEVGTPTLSKLTSQHFITRDDTPVIVGAGEHLATEATVIGATQPDQGQPLSAVAGGVDERLGLVQRVFTESAIADAASLQHAAVTRWEMLGRTPYFLTGQLAPKIAPGLDELIPGATAQAVLAVGIKKIDQAMRLASVSVSASNGDQGMSEAVGVEFIPLGTTED